MFIGVFSVFILLLLEPVDGAARPPAHPTLWGWKPINYYWKKKKWRWVHGQTWVLIWHRPSLHYTFALICTKTQARGSKLTWHNGVRSGWWSGNQTAWLSNVHFVWRSIPLPLWKSHTHKNVSDFFFAWWSIWLITFYDGDDRNLKKKSKNNNNNINLIMLPPRGSLDEAGPTQMWRTFPSDTRTHAHTKDVVQGNNHPLSSHLISSVSIIFETHRLGRGQMTDVQMWGAL